MLKKDRWDFILEEIARQGSVTNNYLIEALSISESTVRRDLNDLDRLGQLRKVFGGAVGLEEESLILDEEGLESKEKINIDEKKAIAKLAASLIEDRDFVYLDSGSTSEKICDYLEGTRAKFVTNSINVARKMSEKNLDCQLLGGQLKATTYALVGEEALANLSKYNFTKAFIGANGISLKNGVTTPDIREARIKQRAILNSRRAYIVADGSKFNKIYNVRFANLEEVIIITDRKSAENNHEEGEILYA